MTMRISVELLFRIKMRIDLLDFRLANIKLKIKKKKEKETNE